MKVTRSKIVLGLLALTITGLWSVASASASGEKASRKSSYNILLILTDQERYFEEWPESIGLIAHDRLRDRGIVFENHYIAATVCTPSRAVLYMGSSASNPPVVDNKWALFAPESRRKQD